jgi:ABC-type nitrate/sulfonate/bicarbonate transport system ATPase subunit
VERRQRAWVLLSGFGGRGPPYRKDFETALRLLARDIGGALGRAFIYIVDNAAFGCPLPQNEAVPEALRRLKEVGIDGGQDLKLKPYELSAGIRKRVEFVRALLSDSAFLLADELFSGLDYIHRERLWALWKKLQSEEPRTAILVTHDIKEALALSDRIVVLSNSRPVTIVFDSANEQQPPTEEALQHILLGAAVVHSGDPTDRQPT